MGPVSEIKQAIERLSAEEYSELVKWLEDYDLERFAEAVAASVEAAGDRMDRGLEG